MKQLTHIRTRLHSRHLPGLLLALCIGLAGSAPPAHAAGDEDGRKIKHWVAPMDPTFISDKPGKSPMGMDLVPVYEDEGGSSSAGLVKIDPVVVQNMGLRVAPVTRGTITRRIRTVGAIHAAEDRLAVVNLRYSGWVEKLLVEETGSAVRRGEPLFEIYSPELLSAQEEYLLALRSAAADSPLVQSARTRLELWGVAPALIKRLTKTRKPLRTIPVLAPSSGYVLSKEIIEGGRVKAGSDLYKIADLDHVWVEARVYEIDAPWIQVGQPATMELAFQDGATRNGEITFVAPTLDPRTRTVTVRMEFDNPELKLKPGMFATVRIDSPGRSDALLLPSEAIIHSGNRELVFVALDLGHYEAREITTGIVGDNHRVEVLSGVREGERVVTSGQFLLDSESQLQEAVQKMLAARLQAREKRVMPESDDNAAEANAATDSNAGESYWTCGMHPQVVQDGPGTCPICGMDLTLKGGDHD